MAANKEVKQVLHLSNMARGKNSILTSKHREIWLIHSQRNVQIEKPAAEHGSSFLVFISFQDHISGCGKLG